MLLHRIAERRPAGAVQRVGIRPFGQQQLYQPGVARVRRRVQRRLALIQYVRQSRARKITPLRRRGPGIHRRPGGQQRLGHFLVTLAGDQVQRRYAGCRLGSGFGPLAQQQVHDGLVAVARGVMQRRQARLLEAVHRRAVVQQQLHHRQLALGGGGLQQRLTRRLRGVD